MSKENALFPVVKDAIAFEALWQQAHEKVTALSGEVWTDTGDHDPGITLLQSATWNCSDLSYRASLPLNDLLTHQDRNTLFPEEFGPEQVLTCNMVTAEDYRRALLDLHSTDIKALPPEQDFLFIDVCLTQEPESHRFHWWYNVEKREYSFTEPTVTQPEDKITMSLRGNLWLTLVPTRYTQALSAENRAAVDQYLAAFLEAHRNLGEAVSRIIWLQPATFSPQITIELADNIGDINQVAAQIYQVTEAFLSPEVTHYTTEKRRALGDSDETIFEGPRLQHGWQQTVPSKITSGGYVLNLGPLVNLLLAIPGVASLSMLSVKEDEGDGHITAVKGDHWRWQVADGYYPLLWGGAPLSLLASDNSPLTLVSKGGIRNTLVPEAMARYLTQADLIVTTPTVLPAGRFRDQTDYIPVGQRLPECYALQQPDAVIDDQTCAVHQFLLPVDQLLADCTADLAQLPTLLAFKDRGDVIRGTRWPYTNAMVQQAIHQLYAKTLEAIAQQDAAILTQGKPSVDNFARELDFIQYLLGYFGTQRAALPLTLDIVDFLATQRAYLAQQPTLGYDRINIRIDQVSALQKRIAARIGLDSICFADNPDLSQLPFYLIEHRQLLPQTPDSTFDNEQTPTGFSIAEPHVTLTQVGSAGKVVQGQLIDLIAIEGGSQLHVSQLLVVETYGDSFTVSTENRQKLHNNLSRLETAWASHNLRWQNSSVWLQDMDYRLNYAEATLQPANPQQRLLASNAQSPYPAMVSVGDGIVIRPAGLQFTLPRSKAAHTASVDADWQLVATVKAVHPITGMLLIEKTADSTEEFPSAETSYRFQWAFSHANYAMTDRFSFVVSAVLNRRLIDNPNIVPEQLIAWVQETIMAEFPAHVSLINHWLDDVTFNNFGATYARWQNSGMPLGDDAFALMQMLTLGHLPVTHLDIGLMRIATEAQRDEVVGDGSQWNANVILREELFYVPKDVPTTL